MIDWFTVLRSTFFRLTGHPWSRSVVVTWLLNCGPRADLRPALRAQTPVRLGLDTPFLGTRHSLLREGPHPMRRRMSWAIAWGALVLAPSIAAAQEGVRVTPPYEATKPFAAFSRSALSLRDSLVAMARAQLGRRYVLGGESPSHGFDCSGLVRYIVSALNLSLPRTAAQQARIGDAIPADTSRLLPGDLVTFGRGKRISHIGIYVGNGRFIHASVKAGRVIETDLVRPKAAGIKPWRGARRLVSADSAYADRDS